MVVYLLKTGYFTGLVFQLCHPMVSDNLSSLFLSFEVIVDAILLMQPSTVILPE
jgi:hypothetical protein